MYTVRYCYHNVLLVFTNTPAGKVRWVCSGDDWVLEKL